MVTFSLHYFTTKKKKNNQQPKASHNKEVIWSSQNSRNTHPLPLLSEVCEGPSHGHLQPSLICQAMFFFCDSLLHQTRQRHHGKLNPDLKDQLQTGISASASKQGSPVATVNKKMNFSFFRNLPTILFPLLQN